MKKKKNCVFFFSLGGGGGGSRVYEYVNITEGGGPNLKKKKKKFTMWEGKGVEQVNLFYEESKSKIFLLSIQIDNKKKIGWV